MLLAFVVRNGMYKVIMRIKLVYSSDCLDRFIMLDVGINLG